MDISRSTRILDSIRGYITDVGTAAIALLVAGLVLRFIIGVVANRESN